MAASFLASFIMFAITGIYELCWGNGANTLGGHVQIIQWTLYGVLLSNACYYYYMAAYLEMDANVVKKLQIATRWEWVVRVGNQTILFALWFLLHFGWFWFGAGLILLYVTYILWDALTWKCFKEHYLIRLDVAGLVITILFLFIRYGFDQSSANSKADQNSLMTQAFILGGTAVAYVVVLGIGVCICKFNPFSKRHFSRPSLH